jgi:hypothetical protein
MTALSREQQTETAIAALAELRAQGWSEASFRISRGGTLDVSVKAADGASIPRQIYSRGVK